ncbi:cytochrome CYP82D47-like [Capsicum chacoense]
MIDGKSYGRVEKGGNEEEEAERFKKALKDFMSIGFVLWDAFPIPLFKWIDFQGHVKFMKRTFRDIDCVLQSWLDEHVKKRESVDFVNGNEEDFIDFMLSMMSNEDFVDGYSRETTIEATALVSNNISCCCISIAFLESTVSYSPKTLSHQGQILDKCTIFEVSDTTPDYIFEESEQHR